MIERVAGLVIAASIGQGIGVGAGGIAVVLLVSGAFYLVGRAEDRERIRSARDREAATAAGGRAAAAGPATAAREPAAAGEDGASHTPPVSVPAARRPRSPKAIRARRRR